MYDEVLFTNTKRTNMWRQAQDEARAKKIRRQKLRLKTEACSARYLRQQGGERRVASRTCERTCEFVTPATTNQAAVTRDSWAIFACWILSSFAPLSCSPTCASFSHPNLSTPPPPQGVILFGECE
ncbi:hypothetical protein L804_04727 [Cryptococcus deuterogattii 2001/935-1]|nr:hypothetical protein L804_04727 [Cryptococcus deuterogattii 2001/935-1]